VDSKHESQIIASLSECESLLELIAKHIPDREYCYLLRVFFIELRSLAYYFSRESSPLISYRDTSFTENERKLIDLIADFRHASSHPESDLNWLNEYMRISCASNFKDNDVTVQFGRLKVLLLR